MCAEFAALRTSNVCKLEPGGFPEHPGRREDTEPHPPTPCPDSQPDLSALAAQESTGNLAHMHIHMYPHIYPTQVSWPWAFSVVNTDKGQNPKVPFVPARASD